MLNIVNRRGESVGIEVNKIAIIAADAVTDRIAQNLHIEDGYYCGLDEVISMCKEFEDGDPVNIENHHPVHPTLIPETAELIVKCAAEGKARFLIYTTDALLLRALEVYTDLYDIMSDIDVYYVTTKANGELNFENYCYSEYGITSLYEELVNKQFNMLEAKLEAKYGEEDF